MLTCDQAEKMVIPYMDNELSAEELEEFLLHIRACPSCRDELETVYTIRMGLLELDGKVEDTDIAQALSDSLDNSWLRVRAKKILDVICYAVDTLCCTGVIVALIMQAARWLH